MKAGKSARGILIVDSGERSADLQYALGFSTPDPIVFLEAGGWRHVVVQPLEYGRALKLGPRVRVWTPQSLGLSRTQQRRISGWAVQLLRRLRIRRVVVPSGFPLGLARTLERSRIRLAVARGSLFPAREIKTAMEIRRIRQVQRVAAKAMRAAIAMIAESRPGADGRLRWRRRRLTSEGVRVRIAEVLAANGCTGRGIIVAGGKQAADPHCRGEGTLRAGETVVIDIFPQHLDHGYWGDMTRTVVKGNPGLQQKRMYRAVVAAQAAALRRVRPGARREAIHRAAAQELRRRGFENTEVDGKPAGFIHGTGHGIGLEIHEGPSLGRAPGRLKAGHVVTVEPGLYYPDLGGVRIEDTVVVTPRGRRLLASCPKQFEV